MKFLIAVLLVLSTNAFAARKLLLTITNDNAANEVSYFYVDTDSNGDAVAFTQESYIGRKMDKKVSFSYTQAYNGVVMLSKKGRDVAILKSKNFSAHNGGHAQLHYLYNGVTNTWNSTEFELVRNGNSWSAEKDGKVIKNLKFFVKKVTFVGVVGIRSISAF